MAKTEKKEVAFSARALVRVASKAALGTVMPDGSPLVTLVALATAPSGTPLLLLSQIAAHTQNIARDARVSLLTTDGGVPDDPMTGARLSLTGQVLALDGQNALRAKARFTQRHPGSGPYDTELDFRYFQLEIAQGRFNQGFGAFRKMGPSDLTIIAPHELAEAEEGIISHMNEDHGSAIDYYACQLLDRTSGGWRMTGIDAEGADLMRGGETARLSFASRISTPKEARDTLISLAQR